MDDRPEQQLSEGPPPRLRLLAFPGRSPPHPCCVDADIDVQRGIVRLLNAWTYLDTSVTVLLKLAALIVGDTNFYITEYCGVAITEMERQMRGVFVWQMASELDLGAQDPIAPYAVSMCVFCSMRFRAICFAKMMMEFIRLNTVANSHPEFSVVSVCYRFTTAGVIAVMFFDLQLGEAYREAYENAHTGHRGTAWHNDSPVTFWPSSHHIRMSGESYDRWLQRTRGLYKRSDRDTIHPLVDITNRQ